MAKDIYALLRRKFKESEYALMEEVSNMAGHSRTRSADFILMNLWPSRGLALSGIELKSFRSDWLSELKNPEKAESIFQYCDHFWLLTTDETVAKIDEIPINWGWMCIKGERILIKKEAPMLNPKPISRDFLAAMLKRAQTKDGFIRRSEIEDKINEAKQSGIDYNKKELDRIQKELNTIHERLREYNEITGIDLTNIRWGVDVKKTGEAVRFLKDGGAPKLQGELIHLEKVARDILARISQGLETIKEQNSEPSAS